MLYTKDARSNPANYCPISLTCVCCKFMEAIMLSHISKHLSVNDIVINHQYGFIEIFLGNSWTLFQPLLIVAGPHQLSSCENLNLLKQITKQLNINDITDNVSSHLRLFADDCVIYRENQYTTRSFGTSTFR